MVEREKWTLAGFEPVTLGLAANVLSTEGGGGGAKGDLSLVVGSWLIIHL